MAETVTMPKLGFDMAEGTLVRWVVEEGQQVEKGAVLAEIETDKATVEVESTHTGVLAKHLVPAGEVVPVNTPIAVIAAPGEKVEDAQPAEGGSPAQPNAAAAASTPNANIDMTPQAQDPPGAAPAIQRPGSPETPPSTGVTTPAPKTTPAAPSEGDGSLPGGLRASPLARRMAAEMRIDLGKVSGSGPSGRITRRDVEAFMSAPAQAAPPAAPAAPASAPAPAAKEKLAVALPPLSPLPAAPAPADETVQLNRLRAAIGRRMVESKQQAPHFYVTHEYDMEPLMELRKSINAMLPDEEKVSVNDFIVKAAALTLRQFPNLNAALQGDKIVRYGAVNIGMAVAVANGLLTVVIRDADRKSLRHIAVEARTLAGRARDGKVRPEDIEGSTFSTSNLGMYDVEHFIAILNPPEAGILAIGAARQVPVVKDGQLAVGWRMKATISVDHRVSDGAEGARYMQALAAYLEQPLRLLV
jgi:pyruvate dehydrogenase E2 component (dihydrolipoamide acetyltransferase)